MLQTPPTPPTPPGKDPIFKILDDFQKRLETTFSEGFNKIIDEAETTFTEMEKASLGISKNLGRGAEFGFGLRQTFVDALPDVKRLGGSISDISKIQGDVIKATGRGIQLAADEFSKFYASFNILNTSADDLVSNFKNIGVSVHDVTKESEKIILTAQKLGLDVSKVYSNVSSYITKINEVNFQNGVEGLTRMAARATALRIDMGETFRFADKVMNPEGAIEMANAFQRLGAGTSALLDPLKLMDLSMNDPEELQNQLVKMTQQFTKFNSETNRFEITNKRMFRELSKELGLSYDELTKMALGGADLNKKLSEIRFPDFVSKEQKELIANMAEMKQGVGYVVRVQEDGEIKEKRITELSSKDIEYLSRAPKTAEEIQKQSLDTVQSIGADVAAIRAKVAGAPSRAPLAEQITRSIRGISDSLVTTLTNSGLKPENISKIMEDVLKTSTRSLMSGNFNDIIKLVERIKNKTQGADISDFMSMFKSTLQQNAYNNMELGDATKFVKEISKAFENKVRGNDFVITEDKVVETHPNDVIFGMLPENIKKEQQEVVNKTVYNQQTLPQPVENVNPVALLEKIKLTMPNMSNIETKNSKMEFGDINVNITLDVKGTQDQNIAETLKTDLQMKRGYIADIITEAVTNAIKNNGLTGKVSKGLPTA